MKQAETNLARTAITAPTTGWVAKLLTAKGNYAQTGQTLMTPVPRDVWVTANFKEPTALLSYIDVFYIFALCAALMVAVSLILLRRTSVVAEFRLLRTRCETIESE